MFIRKGKIEVVLVESRGLGAVKDGKAIVDKVDVYVAESRFIRLWGRVVD